MVKRFRLNVGTKRLSSGASEGHRSNILSVRRQLKRVMDNMQKFIDHMDAESADILKEALEPTFKLSQIYVPVKTGDLKRSGYLETRKFRGRAAVEMGYGRGDNPKYAVLQHENLEFYHEPPTRAKFLQFAVERDEGNIRDRIIRLTREASGV